MALVAIVALVALVLGPPAAATVPSLTRWVPPVPLAGGPERAFRPPPHPYGVGHRGVDLRGAAGAIVRSAGDGTVAFAGLVAGRPVVSVDHRGGLRTTYEPVLASVSVGEQVVAGAVLGALVPVPSHCAPIACLHWGARRGGDYLDPMTLLARGPVRLLPLGGPAAPPASDTVIDASHAPPGTASRHDSSAGPPPAATHPDRAGGVPMSSGVGALLVAGAGAAAIRTRRTLTRSGVRPP